MTSTSPTVTVPLTWPDYAIMGTVEKKALYADVVNECDWLLERQNIVIAQLESRLKALRGFKALTQDVRTSATSRKPRPVEVLRRSLDTSRTSFQKAAGVSLRRPSHLRRDE